MCWAKVQGLFRKEVPLAIPHPEEAMNPLATVENTDLQKTVSKWLVDWQVPPKSYPFLQTVRIELVANLGFPEVTVSQIRLMQVDPRWCVPGVLAHGHAHISYSLLSQPEIAGFAVAFNEALRDPLMLLMVAQHPYAKSNIVEGHAEVYRYLGLKMPAALKAYYPLLI